MKETTLSGIEMDRELETYTTQAVASFTYRNGVFENDRWRRWIRAIAFYRAGVDRRGEVQSRRTI